MGAQCGLHWLRQHGESARADRFVGSAQHGQHTRITRFKGAKVVGVKPAWLGERIGRDRVAIALGQGRTADSYAAAGQHPQPDPVERNAVVDTANAHVDAADGYPVLQIGMDTPQVTAELLADCARLLLQIPAVLGLAFDGGWWVLGIRTPTAAECLRAVPMSQPDTGELTLKALRDNGIDVTLVQRLGDFDIVDDIALVRDCCAPGSRFAQATRAAGL